MSIISRTACPICQNKSFEPYRTCTDHTVSQEKFTIVRCSECGFRFTQNVPDEASIGRYYESEDYISHSNAQKGAVNSMYQLARRYMMGKKRKFVQELSGKTSGRLLDYGCGTGEFAAHMQNSGWSVLGMEPSTDARRFAVENNKIEALTPDELFTRTLEPFDVLTLWHVLEHVHRLHETLARLKELMAPKGVMIVAVPNADAREELTYKEFWAAWDVPRHLYHFDASAMKQLTEQHGLKIMSTRPMPLDAFYVAMLSERYKYGAVDWPRAANEGRKTWAAARKDYHQASSLLYVLREAR